MCLLIAKSANATIPAEHLEQAAIRNSDGAGIVFFADGGLHYYKAAAATWQEIDNILQRFPDAPALVHFRFTTHGGTCDENTHPFELAGGWWGAHNGMITGQKCGEGESDTRAFFRETVIPMINDGYNLHGWVEREFLAEKIGTYNKLAFIDSNGKIAIVNESCGEWENGVWYSNDGYKPRSTYASSKKSRSRFSYSDEENEYSQWWRENTERGGYSAYGGGGTYVPPTPRQRETALAENAPVKVYTMAEYDAKLAEQSKKTVVTSKATGKLLTMGELQKANVAHALKLRDVNAHVTIADIVEWYGVPVAIAMLDVEMKAAEAKGQTTLAARLDQFQSALIAGATVNEPPREGVGASKKAVTA